MKKEKSTQSGDGGRGAASSSRQRLGGGRGIVVCKPFVYGSQSFWRGKQAEEKKSHDWKIYVRGIDNEDLSSIVRRVVFQLHPSCDVPIVVRNEPPFEVSQTGWGEFEAIIHIYLFDSPDRPLDVYHMLRLYPENPTVQLSVKKPVVSEVYDELVFCDPPENIRKRLLKCTSRSGGSGPEAPLTQYYTRFSEIAVMQKIVAAHNFVLSEIARTRKHIARSEAALYSSSASKKAKTMLRE